MKFFFSATAVFVMHTAFAQQVIDVSKQDVPVTSNLFYTVGGEPFVAAKFVNLVEGSPYFRDQWLPAVVVDKADHRYKSNSLRIDLLKNQIHYLDSTGKEFITSTPLKEIVLTDADGTGYKFVHSSSFVQYAHTSKDGWYLCLTSGPASLYQQLKKNLREQTPYGSATVEQKILTTSSYFILHGNDFTEVRKIKELPFLFADKKKELEIFIQQKDKPAASMDERLAAVVSFYNSLVQKPE